MKIPYIAVGPDDFDKIPKYIIDMIKAAFPEHFSFEEELRRKVFRFWTKKVNMTAEKCPRVCDFCILGFMQHICQKYLLFSWVRP